MRSHAVFTKISVAVLWLAAPRLAVAGSRPVTLSAEQRLGKAIFFDTRLSVNSNQSCAECHDADAGWTGGVESINEGGSVYEGSVPSRFGNRKPPSVAYATLAPIFTYDGTGEFLGGNFWDGRATGWRLGNPAADQAQGPFLNPVEQALPDADSVVRRVCTGPYSRLFEEVAGPKICDEVDSAYGAIARAIAAFEASEEVTAFSSKYDAVLAGRARWTALEAQGLRLFEGKGKCSACHPTTSSGGTPVFTDFTFVNIGVPRNPQNPFYSQDLVFVEGHPINPLGASWVDLGLGEFLATLATSDGWRSERYVPDAMKNLSSSDLQRLAQENRGKHRVPSLRNVAECPPTLAVKAYTHNGYFKTLEGLVHFYNTRDVLPECPEVFTEAEALARGCWPRAELGDHIERNEMGNLGLTPAEETAIVAFLRTLSDGYMRR